MSAPQVACLLTLVLAAHASSEVVPDLTPLGAERAGNAAGTIPAWSGGITRPPAGYDPVEHEIDPYPDDGAVATITAANADEYGAYLSEGQRALFERFPTTWEMPIYPSRRSAAFPEWVYDALRRNADIARDTPDVRDALKRTRVTSPFPRPTTGEQVVWNHVLRWRGVHVRNDEGVSAVTPRGRYRLVWSIQDSAILYALPWDVSRGEFDNLLAAVKMKWLAPAQLAGTGALIHEPIDPARDPRKIWRYLPDLRQIVRQPTLGYELPAPYTDGLRTSEDFELFIGPPDAYEWTLRGKKELYIPYNAYRLHSSHLRARDIVGAEHLKSAPLRYELHRVWVIDGTLRLGQRRIYGRRVLYLDEDSWQIAIADSYDSSGRLMRHGEAHTINHYAVPALRATLYTIHDFAKHRYLVEGLDNERRPVQFSDRFSPLDFTPNALNYYVR